MAGIGDYVHARYIDYLKHSTTYDKLASPLSAQQIYATQIAQLKKEVIRNNTIDKAQIEKQLNMFFNPRSRRNLEKGHMSYKVHDKIQEAINQVINQKGKFILNSSNLHVSNGNEYFDVDKTEQEFIMEFNKIKPLSTTFRRRVKAVVDRYKKLMEFRDRMASKIKNDNPNAVALMAELNSLTFEYAQFKKDILEYVKNAHTSGSTIPTPSLSTNENGERFDEHLNRLLEALQLSSSGYVAGLYGELVIKASEYVLHKRANVSVSQLRDYLIECLKTTSRSQKGVMYSSESFFSTYFSGVSSTIGGKTVDYETYQTDHFNATLTEDKVDATIFVDEIGDLNLSIKNYDLASSSELRLESGRDLTRFAQYYPDFTNHFLNIVGERDIRFGYIGPSAQDKTYMYNAMKITAFTKALMGGVFSKTRDGSTGNNAMVDLFVVNDSGNSKGGYKVYFLSELLEKVITDVNLIIFNSFDGTEWNNRWVGDENSRVNAAIRITRLVNAMRAMELKISISPSALK